MAFEVYGDQLQTVPSFKYLGTILTEGDDDWPAVAENLGKARKSWGIMQRILSRERANGRHKNTTMCRSGAERKRRRLAETEVREST